MDLNNSGLLSLYFHTLAMTVNSMWYEKVLLKVLHSTAKTLFIDETIFRT